MSDLIDRQAAIDAMRKLHADDVDMYGAEIPECFDDKKAINALETLPTVYPEQPKMGKWILVSEDIPPAYTEVLLQFDHNMAVGFWNDGEWATNTGDGIYTPIFESEGKPIAWRWLPEWYVEGKDGND